MRKHPWALLPLAALLALTVSRANAQTITVPVTSMTTAYALGPNGTLPFVHNNTTDDPAPYTARVENLQPASWAEWKVTADTPGLYTITLDAWQASDPATVLAFETRPNTTDPYVTRYATPDSMDYGKFGANAPTGGKRTYVLIDPVQDASGTAITVPLVAGENILRIQNVTHHHNPAFTYPADETDPSDRNWDSTYWSNLQMTGDITLKYTAPLPAMGGIKGTVTGAQPGGRPAMPVQGAIVAAGAPGTTSVEIAQFWKSGYYTYTQPDGTFALKAPAGTDEIEAGRPSGYLIQGSRTVDPADNSKTHAATVTVPASSNPDDPSTYATSDLSLTSLFHDDGNGSITAWIQAEYLDSKIGSIGIIGTTGGTAHGQNGYQVGWLGYDTHDTVQMLVDVPETGYYKVSASYSNGGSTGVVAVASDRGGYVIGYQPDTSPTNTAQGYNTLGSVDYTDSTGNPVKLFLQKGANQISWSLLAGGSNFDALQLTLIPGQTIADGVLSGTVTDSLTNTPVLGARVSTGSQSVLTDQNGHYSFALAPGSYDVTVSGTMLGQAVSGSATVSVGTEAHKDFTVAVRPRVDLSSANGFNWTVLPNTGGTADYSAVNADESGFTPMAVPVNWRTLTINGVKNDPDQQYGWARLHFTLPDPLKNALPGHGLLFRSDGIDDVDATYFNGHFIGTTGGFPNTPLAPQAPGYKAATGPTDFPEGAFTAWNGPRDYFIPYAWINPTGDNVISIKIYDNTGGGGVTKTPWLEVAPASAKISGTITSGGAPASKVRVAAMDMNGVTQDYGFTDANGAFTLWGAPTGNVVLAAVKPGLNSFTTVFGNVGENADIEAGTIDMTALPSGQYAPVYDDFSATADTDPTWWAKKWDALSIANPLAQTTPIVYEPGYDVRSNATIPGTLTVTGQGNARSGIMSKAQISQYASVTAARIASALAPAYPSGGTPNAILQLNAAPADNASQYTYSQWMEWDAEGYFGVGGQPRIKMRVFADTAPSNPIGEGPAPIALDSLANISSTNPLDLVVARAGTVWDFYVNGIYMYGVNVPYTAGWGPHRAFPYTYGATDAITWDWVQAGPASAPLTVPFVMTKEALQVWGGLAPAGTDYSGLNVVDTGTSQGNIDLLDVVALMRQSR